MNNYPSPTSDEVRAALRQITTTQLRRAFFEGIENPNWVRPLFDEGGFRLPAEPIVDDRGYIRETYWPEATYLSKVAEAAPEAVVDVLLAVAGTSNSWVRRATFEIGAKIPADQAARLRPAIEAWLPSGMGARTDPHALTAVAVNLLTGGQRSEGIWLADALFRPTGIDANSEPTTSFDSYWYEDCLPRITVALAADAFRVTLHWLVAYERKVGHLTDTSDITYYSRDAIRRAVDTYDKVEHSLIDAVREAAIVAMQDDPDATMSTLLDTRMLLGRKLGLFSLAEAIRSGSEGSTDVSAQLRLARELLIDPESVFEPCRLDYAELARSVSAATGEPIEELDRAIADGAKRDTDHLRSWMTREGTEANIDIEADLQASADRWMHRWLSSIGTDALPAPLARKLAELDDARGVLEGPLEPTKRISSWVGPSSALTQAEFAKMTASELTAHLETWHDRGDAFGPRPTHEGQARVITELVTAAPRTFEGIDDLAERLRPIYLRAIIQGWTAALRADASDLDWPAVADLIEKVLEHADESDFVAEGDRYDDDIDFGQAKRMATGFIEEAARPRDENVIPAEVMGRFAEALIESTEDETAKTEYDERDPGSGMDALTTSMNWRWPMRLRALIHLMSHGAEAPWYLAARTAVEGELEKTDVAGASGAVVGETVGRLLAVDHDWVVRRVPEWFGEAGRFGPNQQIALTTALGLYRYNLQMFELLSPAMIAALELGEPLVAGWRTQSEPLQQIGEWVVSALIHGHKDFSDGVVGGFFDRTPAEVRGGAMGHIAWSFLHASEVDAAIRDRFADLWDRRIVHIRESGADGAELSGFYWIVKCGKFEASWWLPRLNEALRLYPELAAERSMIGKQIAEAADTDPRLALEVLKQLVAGADGIGLAAYDLSRHAIPIVIARASASEDEDLRRSAERYINELGAAGYSELETEVQAVLEGAVRQSDVEDY